MPSDIKPPKVKKKISWGLYGVIILLLIIIAIQGGVVYATYTNSSVTLGVKNPFHETTLDEQIKASEDAINDSELNAILKDAKSRGYLDNFK